MKFEVVCASHNDTILDANLARSPIFLSGQAKLHLQRGAPSAGVAYNAAIDATTAPILVFAHHDVFFPKGWETQLAARLAELDAYDPNWALFGSFGVGLDHSHIGPVWSSSIGLIVGRVPVEPTKVQSFDEMVIILRRQSGIRFDAELPGWHMYGTDIVTQARAKGLNAYAGALPTIHNDRYHEALKEDFVECYQYMRRKWRERLPLRTPIIKISRSGLHLYRNRWRDYSSAKFRANMSVGIDHSPERLADLCGWSELTRPEN
jgi:glycosyltransferase involved in cell wall biosynthesis